MINVTCEEEQHEIVVDYRKEAEEIIRKFKEVTRLLRGVIGRFAVSPTKRLTIRALKFILLETLSTTRAS